MSEGEWPLNMVCSFKFKWVAVDVLPIWLVSALNKQGSILLVNSCVDKALATFSGIILPRDGKEEQFPMHWAADHGRWIGKRLQSILRLRTSEVILLQKYVVKVLFLSLWVSYLFCQPRRDIMEFLLRYPAGEDLLLQRDSQGRIPLFYAERAGNEAKMHWFASRWSVCSTYCFCTKACRKMRCQVVCHFTMTK